MKIKKIQIEGYRRLKNTEVLFGDASFLIGENNAGKSSVLKALELFHSGVQQLDDHDFFFDTETETSVDQVIITAEYTGLPAEAVNWSNFKGRILKRTINGSEELYIVFKKVYTRGSKKCLHSLKEYSRSMNSAYENCKSVQEFVDAGLSLESIKSVYGEVDSNTNLTTKANAELQQFLDDLWDVDENVETWFDNPGGFQGNILIKLPRFLLIPAEDRKNDIDGKTGALTKIMNDLFDDVRDASSNFHEAQRYLRELAKELDPEDDQKEFGKMMGEINSIVGNVFPETGLHVETLLDDANKILKPQFNIEMSSNVKTSPERQGTGSVRSAAFALLRYREQFLERAQNNENARNLIIGFEEPEIYLHPNAANNMRDEIYSLSTSSNSQIVCTTHSPYMIDLSEKIDADSFPTQVLNLIRLSEIEGVVASSSVPFNATEAYINLVADDKDWIKFILKMDDYVARVFFATNILIVEGDTEDVVLRETINRMPDDKRKFVESNYQIIKARGKAAIISLVRYLKSMDLQPFVVHDKDEVEGATKFNAPIATELGGEEHRFMLENCMEDILGYSPPSNNKPYKA